MQIKKVPQEMQLEMTGWLVDSEGDWAATQAQQITEEGSE